MTQAIGEWQADLMKTYKDEFEAKFDYIRGKTIDGFSAFNYYVVSLPSLPDKNEIEKILSQTKGACLIHTPDHVYFIHHPNQQISDLGLDKKTMGDFVLKFKPSGQIQMIKKSSLEEFSKKTGFSIAILDKNLLEIITWNIQRLCNQLNATESDKKLFESWLKMHGGQSVYTFVNSSFEENHFLLKNLEDDLFGYYHPHHIIEPEWTIKNNQITHLYKIELNYLTQGQDFFIKDKDNKIHKIDSQQFEILMKKNESAPILSIDSEVVLEISENANHEPVVKPKLVKYEISCFAETGDLILQSPAKNKNIMSQLTEEASPEIKPERHGI